MNFLDTYKNDLERIEWANSVFKGQQLSLDNIDQLKPGETFFYINRDRAAVFGLVGACPDKFTLIDSHLDIPHIDLKPKFIKDDNDSGCCVLETHYYGGIKKYVYQTVPLLMKIVHVSNEGRKIYTIGDKEDDPVFTMPDLLAHL